MKIKTILFTGLIFIIFGFNNDDLLKIANTYKAQKNYSMAVEIYEDIVQKSIISGDSLNYSIATKELALTNLILKNYLKSEYYFEQLISSKFELDADVLFKYAQVLQINGRSDKALDYYKQWASKKEDETVADSYIEFYNKLKLGSFDDSVTTVNSMFFNTPNNNEFGAVVTNGKLVFSSDKNSKMGPSSANSEKNNIDLFQSDNLNFQSSGNISPLPNSINTLYNESVACFSKDGNTIYFTANNLGRSNKKNNTLGIYTSNNNGYKWQKPVRLEFDSVQHNYAFPSLSSDGKTLFFSSDRPNGMGGMDIYKVEMTEGKWGSPINLGSDINSNQNDVFPFILSSENENILYYSTDGRPGFGGLDIFMSKLVSGLFEPSTILPEPVNSTYDDFSYWSVGTHNFGYFSSNRAGSDDIFCFNRKDKKYEKIKQKSTVILVDTIRKIIDVPIVIEAKPKKTEKIIIPDHSKKTVKDTTIKIIEVKKDKKIVKGPSVPKIEIKKEEKKVEEKNSTIETVKKPSNTNSKNSDYLDSKNITSYYIIIYTAYNFSHLKQYRDTKYPSAEIIRSENNFYLMGFKLNGDVDAASTEFNKIKDKYQGAWFYYPKTE